MNDEHRDHDGGHEIDLRVGHPGDELSALLDGELDDADEDRVRRHLDACEPCRTELDEIEAVRRTVRGTPAVTAPPGFVDGVVDGLVDRRRRADRRATVVTLMAAALALVVGIVAANGYLGAQDEPAGTGGVGDQVALIDTRFRLFPPTPSEIATAALRAEWQARRPGPDDKLTRRLGPDPAAGDDDGGLVVDPAQESGSGSDLAGG